MCVVACSTRSLPPSISRSPSRSTLGVQVSAFDPATSAALSLSLSAYQASRLLKVMTLEGFTALMKKVEPDFFDSKVFSIFEDARSNLEQVRWERKKTPWREAKDKATGKRYFYHIDTRKTLWSQPDFKRDRGTAGGCAVCFCWWLDQLCADLPSCVCVWSPQW